jgi:hypothetical protein
VARAKRTDRAEARRRSRALTAAEMSGDDQDIDIPEPASSSPARGAKPSGGSGQAPRPGIMAAFSGAFHRADVRSDLRTFPTLLRSRALWIPIALVVASTVAIVVLGTENVVAAMVYTYFVQAPAIGAVFLAGFLAPRSSWLIGIVVGLVSALGYSILAVSGRIDGGVHPTAEQLQSLVVYSFVFSPVMGAVFASGAAWYRRFLQLSNPNRGRRSAPPKRGTGNGRSRAAGARR